MKLNCKDDVDELGEKVLLDILMFGFAVVEYGVSDDEKLLEYELSTTKALYKDHFNKINRRKTK